MKRLTYVRIWVFISLIMLMGLGCTQTSSGKIQHISAKKAHELIKENTGNTEFVILDVRTSNEFKQGHVSDAMMLDYYNPNFKKSIQDLDKTKTYLIYCTTGYRSGRTLKLIEAMGFNTVYHLQHGIVEWYGRKLPLVKS